MSFESCMIGLKLNGKLPAGELRADAAPYEAQGLNPEAALLRAVQDKLDMALMEERQIVAAVRAAWEAKGGKPKAVKEAKAEKPAPAVAEPEAEAVAAPAPEAPAKPAPMTDSPAFARWFKGSKVVDAEGKPLVVYHGTPGEVFANFDVPYGGAYFAEDSSVSEFFGTDMAGVHNGAQPYYLRVKNLFDATKPESGAVLDRVEDEYDNKTDYSDPDDGEYMPLRDWVKSGYLFKLGRNVQNEVMESLRAVGYDGVRYVDASPATGSAPISIVVFEPEQVKSATGNSGSYDPADPNIMASLTGDLGMDSALLDHMEAIADSRGMVKADELMRWVRVQGSPGAASLANWLDAMGDATVSESSVIKFMESSGNAMFAQADAPQDSTRRRLLVAAAAAAISPANAGDVKVGKAAPIDPNVLAQRVDKGVEKILRDGQEGGTTSLNGGKALKQAMKAIALTGPKELRALAATIGKLLPDTGTIMLTVDDRRRMNVHGVVELAPFVHLTLFTAEGRTGLSYETVLHEALHIAVAARYRSLSVGIVRGNDAVMGMSAPQAAEALKQFEQVWEEFRTATAGEKFANRQLELAVTEARGNPDEFFVRTLTDPVLQAYMAGKEYKGKTLWARFKDWVQSSLFGFKQAGTAPSWLDAALAATGDVSQAMGADRADFKRMAAISRVQASRNNARATPKGDQGARDLVITHNLTEANLIHAVKMGGIAVPSLAVTKKDSPLSGFGEITLIGSRSMADPKGYAKTQVFGADIYSPRYPSVEHKLDRGALKKLNDALAPARAALGGRELYPDDVRNARDLSDSSQVRYLTLLDMGITIEPTRRDDGTVDGWATDNKIRLALAEKQGYAAAEKKARDLLEQSGAEERIFNGYNNAGTRKYVPHTLENVVKILKKEMRGGEGFSYGLGSVRAHYTPQFKSVKAIQSARDRLVSKDEFEKVKNEIQTEFDSLQHQLARYHPASKNFGFGDTVAMSMSDAAKMGVPRALRENGFDEVPDELRQELGEFLDRLTHLPTEYFEAKIVRDVDLTEFAGAVIPAKASQKVRDLLTARGVRFTEYENEADRAAAIDRFAQELDEADGDVLFSTARVQEDSPEFKKWFGDSKVVNERGEPLVVYHGSTRGGIKRNGGRTSYFTSSREVARTYSEDDYEGSDGDSPVVQQAYLKIINPLMVNAEGEPWMRIPFEGRRYTTDDLAVLARQRGHDGLIVRNVEDNVGNEDLSPADIFVTLGGKDQIKSADQNNGDFDGSNPDIMFSKMPPPAPTWTAPESTKVDTIVQILQDKHIDMKRVVAEIRKTAGDIGDKFDPYLQEELFHGRAATGFKNFLHDELRPLLTDMQARGVVMEDFEQYLVMRHAEETNDHIASINADMPDGGSGVMTQDARDYLANLPPAKVAAYRALAARVDAMVKSTQQVLLDYGLEKQSTIDAWNGAYQHYVPLNREDMDTMLQGMGTGQGFSIRGASSKRRTGSDKKVVNVLANLAMAREKAIVRGEKNRLDLALYGLALKAPNPEFWKPVNPQKNPAILHAELLKMGLPGVLVSNYMDEPKQKVVVPRSGGTPAGQQTVPGVAPAGHEEVVRRVNTMLRSAPNVVSVRVNGEDRFIFFNDKDERALRMAMSLKNLGGGELNWFLGTAAVGTRWFASVNTQYNPIFGVVNLTRDAQAVMLNLTSTPLNGKQAQVMAELSGMLWKTGGKWFRLDSLTGQDAALWEEFQREGGITGYRAMFANGDDRARELQNELARMSRGIMAKSGGAVMDWLSDYNEALENVTRMAVYKVARAEGLSAQQAASIAKNISTNFNRKGQIGSQIGALYAFFNAAVQGTTRIAQTLTGPAGKKIVGGGLLLGVIQAVMLAAAGFESDEPPEFIKAKSLVIPIGWATGQKDYLTVPMPLGYNVLPTISRLATEFMLGGGKKPSKYIVNMAGAIADAFNPIGNAGFSIQTVLPTVVDPLAALESNRDYTGKKIYNEDMSPMSPTPGHTRARGGASIPAKLAAEGINWLGGGNDYVPGVWSPTPEHLEYLTGQLTGGIGREILKGFQTGQAIVTGEELAAHRIPLAGRFYGTTTDGANVRDHFRSNLLELNLLEQEYEGRMEDKKGGKEFRDANPILTLADEAQAVQREVAGMNKEKRRLMESGAPRDKVRLMDDKMRGKMQKFNDKVKAARKREASAEVD